MIQIKRLVKPNKKSGYGLAPGKTTKVRGVTIINTTEDYLRIDTVKAATKKK